MPDTDPQWTEDISNVYRQIAPIVVPARTEQIAALLTLIPFTPDERFRVVELASGEGRLAHAILSAFPHASLLALDIEDSMRTETEDRLQPFGERGSVAVFDMKRSDWYEWGREADVIVSSLCVHHLDGAEKRVLFQAMQERLSDRGALLIADIMLPQCGEANELCAATLDRAVKAASIEQTGSDALYKKYQQAGWNLFRYPDPDFDKPSPLFDQLMWLKEAGFALVDCFWLQAGHAIYGGYKSTETRGGILFEQAWEAARAALEIP